MAIEQIVCPNCEDEFYVSKPVPLEHRCKKCNKLLFLKIKLVEGKVVIRPRVVQELKD